MEDPLWASTPIHLVLNTSARLAEQTGSQSPSSLIPPPRWCGTSTRRCDQSPLEQTLNCTMQESPTPPRPPNEQLKAKACALRDHRVSFWLKGSQRSFLNLFCTFPAFCWLEGCVAWCSHTPPCWLLLQKRGSIRKSREKENYFNI